MAVRLVTAPSVEPVDFEMLRSHLRIDSEEEFDELAGYVRACREYVETTVLRSALITQTWELLLDAWPDDSVLMLPKPPLQGVMSVTYVLADESVHTFSSSNYFVDADSQPGRLVLKGDVSWPSGTLRVANGVTVRFVAGYGDAVADVPEPIRQALLLMVGDLYNHREDTVVGQGMTVMGVPFSSGALLSSYRMF